MSDAKIIIGDNFESGGGSQTVVKDQATLYQNSTVHVHQNQPPTPVIPRQLPPLDACFLGRDKELDALLEQLQPGKVAAVCGPGGMGKSALAAQAVHKLEADRFPDGIVFHSFYHQPSTDMALQRIAKAFGIKPEPSLEMDVEDALAGRKALLILDGAEEADDLKAVLALRSTCGVLITSRKRADAQGFRLDLKPLEEQPAAAVFCEHSGAAADDESVQGICKILDGWPVGLRIAGRYCSSTGESAAGYLRWLEKRPFRKLRTGEHQEENAALLLRRSVKKVSWQAQIALRIIGALAFDAFTERSVVALLKNFNYRTPWEFFRWLKTSLAHRRTWLFPCTDDDLRFCRDVLNELVAYCLLEKQNDRWKVNHALIHVYLRSKMPLNRQLLKGLARYYIAFCQEQSSAGLEGYARLDAERAHCLRLMESCLASKLWQEVKLLVAATYIYLDRQSHWTEKLAAVEMRLTAAQQAGDRKDESWCLNSLGCTRDSRGESEKALAYYEQSLTIYREIGDRQGEGALLNNIAEIYLEHGKHELAVEQYKQSLSIARDISDREGEGTTLNNIGRLYYDQGDYEQALQQYEQCLPIKQEIGNEIGAGKTLNNIAAIYDAQGNSAKALKYYEQALAICQQHYDRAGEAQLRRNIGLVYEDIGDLAKAEEYMSHAVQLAEKIGHPSLEKWRKGLALVRAKRQAAPG